MSSLQWMRDPTPETSPLKRARLAPRPPQARRERHVDGLARVPPRGTSTI